MTTSTVQPKWALIGVRVCAVYLAVWAIAALWMAFTVRIEGALTWLLPILFIPGAILFGLMALGLWRLRTWGRTMASTVFVGYMWMAVFSPIILLTAQSPITPNDLLYRTVWAVIGFIGWIFLRRPAVKALFENQSHVDFF